MSETRLREREREIYCFDTVDRDREWEGIRIQMTNKIPAKISQPRTRPDNVSRYSPSYFVFVARNLRTPSPYLVDGGKKKEERERERSSFPRSFSIPLNAVVTYRS